MTIEELQILITANTNDLRKEIARTNNTLGSLERTSNKTSKGVIGGFKFMKTAILALGIGKLIQTITNGMDGAIARVDTMNNFPRTMSNLGIGAEQSQMSIDRLSEKLKGLPTTLNDAALSVQRFTSSNGNIKASTEMFLAMNNAVLAGNAPMEMQRSAVEQLSQAYSKGKPDMMEWRAAMSAMPAQLKQVALSMGYASADALGESLRNGTLTMNEFMLEMIKLNREGVAGFQSFEEQARNATGGISTSIANVKTAVTRGIADILNTIGQANIAAFFNGITNAINATIPYLIAFIKVVQMAVGWVSALFGRTAKQTQTVGSNVQSASKSMGGLSSSAGNASKGIDKATKSTKKLKKEMNSLADFDGDLHVMKQESDSPGGSGGGSAGGASASPVDLSGLDFDWGDQIKGADKVNQKVQELLGHVKKLGAFFDEYKVPILSTLAAVLAGLGALGVISLLPKAKALFDTVGLGLGVFKLWTSEMGIVKGTLDLLATAVGTTSLVIGAIVLVVAAVAAALTQLWLTNEGFRESVIGAWNGIKDTLSIIYNTVIAPILQIFKDALVLIWTDGVKPLWDGWVEFIRSITVALIDIWDNVLKPYVDWFVVTFGPILTNILKVVMSVFSGVMAAIGQFVGFAFKNIGAYVEGIVGVFTGLITFIRGVFSGDWKMAWNGVVKIFDSITGTIKKVWSNMWNFVMGLFNTGGKVFDGIKDGIVGAFTAVVNALIKGINKVVGIPFNAVNGILNWIRDFSILGAKPFSGMWGANPIGVLQIPNVPAYEEGTNYVPETGLALLHKGEEVRPAKQGKRYEEKAMQELETIQILLEMNMYLKRISEKDTNVYMDTEKMNKKLKSAELKQLKALGIG
ncbi:tape measure protein [Erysipelothrix urinaevulpis]|uniref:tape measure protein n=1 Tax=Erysipelothrix urinaevulpis TaxID=2683717 RepID=UPI00135AD929|nr:tape measure protein [Erysipelothrix urinaevulpis]